jgi:outer membrane protein assembly factor BamE (lipoprotein component of BamABCDE complex)
MPDEIEMLLRQRRSALPFLLAAASVLALSACSWPQDVRGYAFDPDSVAQVQPGKSNKADVTRLMGSPSTASTFDATTWYYITRRIERRTLNDPELLEQRVYVVQFDDKGVVKDLQTHENEVHDVEMIARTTPAPGKELSFIEQLLGNFGRFNGDKKKDKSSQSQGAS